MFLYGGIFFKMGLQGKRMNVRGELTSQQLVTIIILIISFAVIVFFLYEFNFKSDINKEACRNSVVLRASAPLGKETVKLQCKTQDVCLTKGSCSGAPADTQIVKVKNQQEMMHQLALLMYDCWWQTGEGKLDYQPKGWSYSKNYCAICSRIRVDDSIKKDAALQKIPLIDFYRNLQREQIPKGEQSYLQYFYGVSSLDAVQAQLQQKQNIDIYGGTLDLTLPQGYALMTSMTKKGWGALAITSVGVVGGTIIGIATGPVGWTVSVAALSAAAQGAVIGGAIGGVGGLVVGSGDIQYLTPSYYPYTEEALKGLNCDEFSNLP